MRDLQLSCRHRQERKPRTAERHSDRRRHQRRHQHPPRISQRHRGCNEQDRASQMHRPVVSDHHLLFPLLLCRHHIARHLLYQHHDLPPCSRHLPVYRSLRSSRCRHRRHHRHHPVHRRPHQRTAADAERMASWTLLDRSGRHPVTGAPRAESETRLSLEEVRRG